MKQHSYGFYTGWLSNEYLRRNRLQKELHKLHLEDSSLVGSDGFIEDKEKLLMEITNTERDLTGQVYGIVKYPHNLTFWNFLDYMFCPTLVYELEYPRTERYIPTTFFETTSLLLPVNIPSCEIVLFLNIDRYQC